MARHGIERSLHSPQSMHPDTSSPNATAITELAPLESATCTDKVNANSTGSASGTVPSPSISSSCDSRIPRPSLTGLRRSASMRMRGERISPNQPPPPPPSTAANAALNRRCQCSRRSNLLQHHHLDHQIFPVITENGSDSPRQRSLVSNALIDCLKGDLNHGFLDTYYAVFVRCRSQMRADISLIDFSVETSFLWEICGRGKG